MRSDVRDTIRRIYYQLVGRCARGRLAAGKKHGEGLLHGMVDPQPFPAWLPRRRHRLSGEASSRGRVSAGRSTATAISIATSLSCRSSPAQKIEQPALFMAGDRDVGIRMFGRDVEPRMREHFADLRGFHMIEGAGHWNQQEKPEETNRAADGLAEGPSALNLRYCAVASFASAIMALGAGAATLTISVTGSRIRLDAITAMYSPTSSVSTCSPFNAS